MANNIFDFLGIDLDAALKNILELKNNLVNTYNDKVNDIKDNIKKYDLDTQEGYEAFINEAADIRKQLVESKSMFSDTMIKILDRLVEKVMNEHTEKKLDNVQKEIVRNEVERVKNENHGKLNVNIKPETKDEESIEWPSDNLTYKQSKNVWNIVNEYMEEMIEPYVPEDVDDEVLDNMASGLYEFAAWVLTREE
ncbi:MAG: hypothetical protein IJH39_11925 [Clostridia bacterium]|nr:hypothetical protein [Clostridia bacterium]